jgi:molybdate transport repressor ModE-like protein
MASSTLQPRVLRYLAAVAHTGSIQAAAREVAISASAIDRQLLQLEEELGVPLFEREPRGMRMTAAGEVVLALAQRWRTDLNRTLSDIKQLQGVHQGQVRLAAMDSHANGLLPAFIAAVAQQHPGIVLEVEIATPDEAVRRLHEGEADVAIAFNVKPQRDLHLVWSAELPLGCVVAARHALAARATLTLREVAAWPMAVQSRALAIRRYLERKHAWLLAEARPPLVTNSLQLVKSLIAGASHVAITSELDAAPEILAGHAVFIPLEDRAAQPQTACVAISAKRPLPRIARVVADLLGQQAQAYLGQVRAAAHRGSPTSAGARPRSRRRG